MMAETSVEAHPEMDVLDLFAPESDPNQTVVETQPPVVPLPEVPAPVLEANDPWSKVFVPATDDIEPFNIDTKTGGIINIRAIEAMDPAEHITPTQAKKARKYIGVTYEVSRGGWKVRISLRSKEFTFGYYNSPLTAALVYDAAKINMKGPSAILVPGSLNYYEKFLPAVHHPKFRSMPPAIFSTTPQADQPRLIQLRSPAPPEPITTRQGSGGERQSAHSSSETVMVNGRKLQGVYHRKGTNKFEASITFKNVKHHCGMYPTALEAARARDKMGLALWGLAFLERCNFPEEAADVLAALGAKPSGGIALEADEADGQNVDDIEAPEDDVGGDDDKFTSKAQTIADLIKPSYKGVKFRVILQPRVRAWIAKVTVGPNTYTYGTYPTARAAAAAYDRALYCKLGAEAVASMNFPEELDMIVKEVERGEVPRQFTDEDVAAAGDSDDAEGDPELVYNPRTGKKWKGVNAAIRQTGRVFQARVMWQGKRLSAGYFSTPLEAAMAHDKKMLEIHNGQVPFAMLNFPPTSSEPEVAEPAATKTESRKRPRPSRPDNAASGTEAKRARVGFMPSSNDVLLVPTLDSSLSGLSVFTDTMCTRLLAAQLAVGTALNKIDRFADGDPEMEAVKASMATATLNIASSFAVASQLHGHASSGALSLRGASVSTPIGPIERLLLELPSEISEAFSVATKAHVDDLSNRIRTAEAALSEAMKDVDRAITENDEESVRRFKQHYESLSSDVATLQSRYSRMAGIQKQLVDLPRKAQTPMDELDAFAPFVNCANSILLAAPMPDAPT